MGYVYAFDAGASNGYNSMVGGYNPPNENQHGPRVGLEALLGDWLIDYDETISSDGIFSWNAIENAGSYRVFAFRYGQQFPVNTPANLRQVWAGGFNPTANAEGVDTLTAHNVRSSVGIETFSITNNTRLLTSLATAYADTTATSFDITTMGLEPGRYEFRVQAIAPENQGPPLASPPLINLPFKNALASGVLMEDERSLNIVTGTNFPQFVIEGAAPPQPDPDYEVPVGVILEIPTINQDGRTYAPIRAIAEALGYEVNWTEAGRVVTLSRNETVALRFSVGQAVSGMEAPSILVDGRTFVPVSFAVSYFGAAVSFDSATGMVGVIVT